MMYPATVHRAVRVVDSYGSYGAISYGEAPEAKKWTAGEIALSLATIGAVVVGVSMIGGFAGGSSKKDLLAQL